MTAERSPRRPAAFRLSEVRFAEDGAPRETQARRPVIVTEPDPFEAVPADPAPLARQQRRFRWLRVLGIAAGGLITLALGLAVDSLVETLFARTGWLGWLGLALAALAVLAVLAISIREIAGLVRLRKVAAIQKEAAEAAEADDRERARAAARDLIALYADRPEAARGRKALEAHIGEIIDGRDLIGLAETELLVSHDEAARRLVLATAKRVSLVTAISPRALVDVLFVLTQILGLIRKLATLYGGRPGSIGFLRLTRAVVSHLALTGGMAAGDSLVQQVLGHGLAARISARLGEGVINGILTARVGIAAIEVCRPLPFIVGRPPRMADVMAELTRRSGTAKEGSEPPAG